jgi:hypothetical protein
VCRDVLYGDVLYVRPSNIFIILNPSLLANVKIASPPSYKATSLSSRSCAAGSPFFHTETQEQYLTIKTSYNIKNIFLSINRR